MMLAAVTYNRDRASTSWQIDTSHG